MFSGRQNVELFSVRVSDRSKYYCRGAVWWRKYEDPVSLFVSTPLILIYYNGLELRGSVDDKTSM